MPPHEPQNRKERLAAKAKQRTSVAEAEPRTQLRQLMHRQTIYQKLKEHQNLGYDRLALFLQTGAETELTLVDKRIVTLIYDDESEVKPSTHHLCVYTEPFSPGTKRTAVRVLYPIMNVQSQINQLMTQLRNATATRKKA